MFTFDIMILLTFEEFSSCCLMASHHRGTFLHPSSSINFSSCRVRSSTTSRSWLSYHNVIIIARYLTHSLSTTFVVSLGCEGRKVLCLIIGGKIALCVDKSIFLTLHLDESDLMKIVSAHALVENIRLSHEFLIEFQGTTVWRLA